MEFFSQIWKRVYDQNFVKVEAIVVVKDRSENLNQIILSKEQNPNKKTRLQHQIPKNKSKIGIMPTKIKVGKKKKEHQSFLNKERPSAKELSINSSSARIISLVER